MKRAILASALSVLVVLGGRLPLRAATPVIGSQLFQETNARIDELFRHHNGKPAPFGPKDNPFRTFDATPPPVAPPTGAVPHAKATPDVNVLDTADEALLRLAAGNLNFGGLLETGGVLMVVINKATFKEGGLLVVRVQGSPIYLRVITLRRDSITLGLNEARLTLYF